MSSRIQIRAAVDKGVCVILAKREHDAHVRVNTPVTTSSEPNLSVTFSFAGKVQSHTLEFSSVEEGNAFMLEAMTSGCTHCKFQVIML